MTINNKKLKTMAIPIRAIPVLEGEVAKRFLREAHKVEKKPRKMVFSESTRKLVHQANEDLRKYYATQYE